MSNAFVVAMGIGVVFIGLICIVILCKILSAVCMISEKKSNVKASDPPVPNLVTAAQPIPDRQQVIAAVSAAVAEDLGTDVSAIRILSFRKI